MNLNDYVKPQVLSNMRCVAYLIDLMTGLLRESFFFLNQVNSKVGWWLSKEPDKIIK